MPQVKIQAHKAVGLEVDLGGKKVAVPAGGVVEETLSGDHVGTVRAVLEEQEANVRAGPAQFGGHVVVAGEEVLPPPGSKKWRALVKAGEHKPKTDELVAAVAAFKGVDAKALVKEKLSRKQLLEKLELADDGAADAPSA